MASPLVRDERSNDQFRVVLGDQVQHYYVILLARPVPLIATEGVAMYSAQGGEVIWRSPLLGVSLL